jgi:SusD family.
MFISACQDLASPDMNNPSVTDYSNITSISQVSELATGVLGYDRGFNTSEILRAEIMGRDAYNLPVSEPRWVADLLGPNIDPGGFNGTTTWPYTPIREANIGIHGVDAADAAVLTDEQKNATNGFLRTFKALSYLRAIETRDSAGAPIAVDIEPTGPVAPLACKGDVLAYIVALLDSANTNLAAGGAEFPFSLPSGFADFDDPAGFAKFNRALAAKVNIYLAFRAYAPAGGSAGGPIDGAYLTAADAALNASFLNTGATTVAALNVGPQHTYSTASGDATNALYGDPASTDYRANPRVVSEADAGDNRVARKVVKTSSLSLSGVGSDWAFTLYPNPVTPVSIITNKELILLKAEVEWGKGNAPGALTLANIVRTVDGGLAAKVLSDPDDVLDQILYEKRYSLLWESPSRWLDARLFGKLNGSNPPAGLGMENDNAPLWNIPIPQPEVDARGGDLTKACTVN